MTAEELFCDLYEKYGDRLGWMMCRFSERTLRNQVQKEIKPGHFLYGKIMFAVAKCETNDDVLFVTGDDDGNDLYVIVHLTWSENTDAGFPKYIILGDLKKVREYFENECEG